MRILLFILSLFFCVTIDAQKLTVESFAENTRDRDYGRSVRPVCP